MGDRVRLEPRVNVRVVSYDFWSTLAVGNPRYKRRRVELMAGAFGAEPAAVEAASDAADAELDERTLRDGRQYGFRDRVLRTAVLAGVTADPDLRALEAALDDAFRCDPPGHTEPTLPDTLRAVRRTGRRVAVVSNTGFVSGRMVREGLRHIGVAALVDHTVFSDEVGHAKPARQIFQKLAAVSGVGEAEILHVGDNRLADYSGARAAGLRAMWYRPGGAPGPDVLGAHRDLLDALSV
jgi:putative hydrolase of the HAD superfamily